MPLDPRILLMGEAPKIDNPMDVQAKAMQLKKAQGDINYDEQIRKLDTIGRLTSSVKDQASYDAALNEASTLGIDISKLPRSYDPDLVKRYQNMAISTLDRLKMESDEKNRQESRAERYNLARIAREEKMQALETPYGLANSTDDAKKLKDAHEMKKSFDRNLQAMIDLRKKHNGGAILNRDDVGIGKQLSKDLLLQYKELAKLGVLSVADEAILNEIIPADPLEYNSPVAAIQGQDPIKAKLENFKKNSDKDFQTRISTRTRAGIKNAGKTVVKTQTNQKTGEQRVVYSDGTTEILKKVAGGP